MSDNWGSWGNNSSSGWGDSQSSGSTGTTGWGSSQSSGSTGTTGWGASPSPQPSSGGDSWGGLSGGESKKKKRKFPWALTLGIGIPVLVIALGVTSYFTLITPPVKEIPVESTAAQSLRGYIGDLNKFDVDAIQSRFDNSFVAQEKAYLNNNEVRTAFVTSVVKTVKFEVPTSQKLNWFSKPAINPINRQPVTGPSTLNFGEKATFTYPDYSAVKFDRTTLESLIEEAKLTTDDVEFSRKLTDIFAKYLSQVDLPTKTVERAPEATCKGNGVHRSCSINVGEDTYWDDQLFGSVEFRTLQDKFSEAVISIIDPEGTAIPLKPSADNPNLDTNGDGTPDAVDEDGDGKPEQVISPNLDTDGDGAPDKFDSDLDGKADPVQPESKKADKSDEASSTDAEKGAETGNPTDAASADPSAQPTPIPTATSDPLLTDDSESTDTDKGEDKESKESFQRKYADKYYTEPAWIGAHYLSEESKSQGNKDGSYDPTAPKVGDGTFDHPAGVNTPIVTFQYSEDGKKIPIQVTMTSFYTDDAAFKMMEGKSQQNRGFNVESEVKYAYYTFEVKNLSTEKITIPLNDTLSDPQRNLTNRTGTVYGLKNVAADLEPGETEILESWTSSTNLNGLYLIWGANFSREDNPVWFLQLAAKNSK